MWRKKGINLHAQAGDISCIHPDGHTFAGLYYVECKFYSSLNFEGLITGKGHFINFWNEARKQAKQAGKTPLLVAKQNRTDTVACVAYSGAENLKLNSHSWVCVPHLNLRIIQWKDFLKHAVKP